MNQSGPAVTATTVADSVPSSGVDFGYCGILQTATRTFTLVSPHAQGVVKFEFETTNSPFIITPMSGKYRVVEAYLNHACFLVAISAIFNRHLLTSISS